MSSVPSRVIEEDTSRKLDREVTIAPRTSGVSLSDRSFQRTIYRRNVPKGFDVYLAKVMVVALLSCSSVVLTAQSTTNQQRHSIQARQNKQQARIPKGVQDGQIAPAGAAHAEANQAKIASRENSMRAADGGHLTASDRHKLARQQNRTSAGIYDRNHNQYTDPA